MRMNIANHYCSHSLQSISSKLNDKYPGDRGTLGILVIEVLADLPIIKKIYNFNFILNT